MTKRALLIGLNYSAIPSARLFGCINDIVNVRNALIDAYGYKPADIVMLRDDSQVAIPTKANILSQLAAIIGKSTASDEIWIHYSGHGTQVRDTNGDETDGADEAIVPLDFQTAGFILDDDLFTILKSAKCPTIVFSDSCHSGSICDLQFTVNYVSGSFSRSVSSNKVIANPNVIVMSGCRDAQTSADAYSDLEKLPVGAFTDSLLESLRSLNHTTDIMTLYNATCARLIKVGYSQIPVLSSSVMNPVKAFTRYAPPPPAPVIVAKPATKPTTTSGIKPSTTVIKPTFTVVVGRSADITLAATGKRRVGMKMFI